MKKTWACLSENNIRGTYKSWAIIINWKAIYLWRQMKSAGILIALMLVIASLPSQSFEKTDKVPINICVVNGFFVYMGENESRIYFRAIYGRMAFITEDKGAGFIYLINSTISFSKPFHSFALSLDNYTLIILAISSNWNFVNAS